MKTLYYMNSVQVWVRIVKKLDGIKLEILDMARYILKTNPKSLSIRKIATECNIGTGTVYNYYKNKDEIVIDLMSGYWTEFMDKIRVHNFEGDAKDNLRELFDIFSVYGKQFRFELLNGTDKEVILKAREFHKKSFYSFVEFIQTMFSSLSVEDAMFIGFNMFAILTTPGYEFRLLERIVLEKLL